MSEQNPFDAMLESFRQIVREELATTPKVLLTPEELAEKMKIPVSWVYEQSRQNAIPTHRIGRYIRFDLNEVLESQRKKEFTKNPLTLVK
jgi:excisionase family DNA binding protein